MVWMAAVGLIFCAACQSPSSPSSLSSEDMVASIVAATMQNWRVETETHTPASSPRQTISPTPPAAHPTRPMVTATTKPADGQSANQNKMLPHTVYYLSGETPARFQVWRMEKDGITQTQITQEEAAITDFTVSPRDGSVVYLVHNLLYWIDAEGRNRHLLVDGGTVSDHSDTFYYYEKINSPRFSPGGNTIAYGRGGLLLYDIAGNTSRMMVENRLVMLEEGGVMPAELFFPESWSPDGRKILVKIGWMEGGSYAILDVGSGSLQYPSEKGILCCNATWTADSRSVLISSRHSGMIESGLWRFDASGGKVTALLSNTTDSYNYVDWVLELPNGNLQFFFHNSSKKLAGEVGLKIVQAAPDAVSNRRELRPEEYTLYSALWAADGSFALVILPRQDEATYPQYGPLALLDLASGELKTLLPLAYQIQWGP